MQYAANIVFRGGYFLEESSRGETALRQVKALREKNAVRVVKALQNIVCKLMIDRYKIISVGAYSNDICNAG
jgi:hypothetical protein